MRSLTLSFYLFLILCCRAACAQRYEYLGKSGVTLRHDLIPPCNNNKKSRKGQRLDFNNIERSLSGKHAHSATKLISMHEFLSACL